MKIHFLSRSLHDNGRVFRNNSAAHLQACASVAEVSELGIPSDIADEVDTLGGKMQSLRKIREARPELIARIKEETSSPGPHILLHTVMSPWDLRVANRLAPVWDRFDHRIVNVIESLGPEVRGTEIMSRYDLLTCFCEDLRMELERAFGLSSLHWPAHTDVLGYASVGSDRPIDLLQVGRRDLAQYERIDTYCRSATDRPFLLDFSTRPNASHPSSAAVEFERLMNTYARAQVAFCETPATIPRFKGRGPLTARWVHGWTAGCTVIATRPMGSGVDALTDWPESMLEFPENPDDEIPFILDVLSDEEGLHRRRHRNVAEALRRHDTRHRLAALFDRLNLPRPERLKSTLESIESKAEAIDMSSGQGAGG